MKRTAFLIIFTALLFGTRGLRDPAGSCTYIVPPTQISVETGTFQPVFRCKLSQFTSPTKPVLRWVPNPMKTPLLARFRQPLTQCALCWTNSSSARPRTNPASGLRLVSSGFTHLRDLKVENGIARVYLGGVCANNGAAYSVGNLIMKNLSQFPQITAIKIYDENDSNLDPDSNYELPALLPGTVTDEPIVRNILPG